MWVPQVWILRIWETTNLNYPEIGQPNGGVPDPSLFSSEGWVGANMKTSRVPAAPEPALSLSKCPDFRTWETTTPASREGISHKH
jgi:hypothetical protein